VEPVHPEPHEILDMSLVGSSLPLDQGGFVVTVICPNQYSHARLMQVLSEIVPEAGEPKVVQSEDGRTYQLVGLGTSGIHFSSCPSGGCGED
jgi:hypothetical protein